jgi:hypothetical protein
MESPGMGVSSSSWLRRNWVRRQYHIEDGYIKPVPGSEPIPYNPLVLDDQARHRKNKRRLVDDLLRLHPRDYTAVAEFASHWGLLGLFQHHLVEQFYIPTESGDVQTVHDPRFGLFPTVHEGVDFYDCMPSRRKLEWSDDTVREDWVRRGVIHRAEGEKWVLTDLGKQLLLRGWRAKTGKSGTVSTDLIRTGAPKRLPLQQYYQHFFPDAQKVTEAPDSLVIYPRIGSEKLWDQLCEPLDLFHCAVIEFRSIAWAYSEQNALPIRDDLRQFFGNPLSKTRQVLVSSPAPDWDQGGRSPGIRSSPAELGWAWPSLLAAAYLLLMRDVTGNYGPRDCHNESCRTTFMPTRPDRKYCSPECRNQQMQRRNYHRMKRRHCDQVEDPS